MCGIKKTALFLPLQSQHPSLETKRLTLSKSSMVASFRCHYTLGIRPTSIETLQIGFHGTEVETANELPMEL